MAKPAAEKLNNTAFAEKLDVLLMPFTGPVLPNLVVVHPDGIDERMYAETFAGEPATLIVGTVVHATTE